MIFGVPDNTERFPEKYRLKRPSDFQEVFKTATRYADKKFLVLARNNDMEIARLGLAVSAKRIRTAVRRNKVKRLIRESFRRNRDRLRGLDIVVVVHKGAGTADNALISQALCGIWDRMVR